MLEVVKLGSVMFRVLDMQLSLRDRVTEQANGSCVFLYERTWLEFTVCVRILGWAWRLSGWAAMSLVLCRSLSVSIVRVTHEMALFIFLKKR
jgi:hypothetical protein